MLTNPRFSSTFLRVQDMIEEGTTVNYINFFASQSYTMLSNDVNDPSYWESTCEYLGTYNGYKFLYLESSAGVESTKVSIGNISHSIRWDEIAQKSLRAVLDHYVKGTFYKAVTAVTAGLSDFFSVFETPLKVTYNTSGGYLNAGVSGEVYIRTILIRDDKDRIKGYAYYNWGSTEMLDSGLRVEAKYPIRQRTNNTYDYATESYTIGQEVSATPGFYGNVALYNSIISLYNNTIGYFTHSESIDIYTLVAKMLS